MPAGFVEFVSVVLFLACLYHSWRTEGRRYAYQWFLAGYYFAVLWLLLLVQLGQVSYSGALLLFGSAPSLLALLVPALFYTAYAFAQAFFPDPGWRKQALVIFLLTPALSLPFDATALQFGWWSFPSESISFLNGIPYYLPLAWGLTGTIYYLFVYIVRRIRLRGSGQLFALVLAAPLVVGLDVVIIALMQLLVNLLGFVPENMLLNMVLALILLILPLLLTLFPIVSRSPGRERGG